MSCMIGAFPHEAFSCLYRELIALTGVDVARPEALCIFVKEVVPVRSWQRLVYSGRLRVLSGLTRMQRDVSQRLHLLL